MGTILGVDVAIFDVDMNGCVAMLNQKAVQLTGFDDKILIGKKITDLFSEEAHPVLSELINNNNESVLEDLTDGVSCQYYDIKQQLHSAKLIVRHNQKKNGFWFILDDRSEVEQMRNDISKLKDMAKEITQGVTAQTSQEISQNSAVIEHAIPPFVTSVSHEMRAPLNAISGYADLIEKEVFGALPDKRYKEYAASIRGAGEYALSIVNDLLDYAKLESGSFKPRLEHVNISTVIDEAIDLTSPMANMRKIEIMKTILQGIPPVTSDARLLKQVIVNLLTNAIKHSSDNDQVLLTAGPTKNKRIMIEITDFGRGMTEQEIERAFIPFSANSDLKNYPSTGLGLFLSRSLTEILGGRFTINSVPNEKTRMRLIFDPTALLIQ